MKSKRRHLYFFCVVLLCFGAAVCFPAALSQGILLLKQGKSQEAVSFFERLTNQNPSDAQAYYYLGTAYFNLGNMDAGLLNYRKALELRPDVPDYHYSLAQLFLALGEEENSLKEFAEVVRLAPQTALAKRAEQARAKLENSLKEKSLTGIWSQKAEEERKRAELAAKEGAEKKETGMTAPGEGPGQARPAGEAGEKLSLEKLIKRLRYGVDARRKEASEALLFFTPEELKDHVGVFVVLLDKEKNLEIKKNIVRIVARTRTPEGTDALLAIMDSAQESFEIKLVTLVSLGDIREEKVQTALRNTLTNIVSRRVQQREEAKGKLADTVKALEELEVERITLEAEISTAEQKKNEIQGKLSGGMMFGEPGGPRDREGLPPEFAERTLKPAEVKKLQEQLKTAELDLKTKRDKMEKLQAQKSDLEAEQTKYKLLLGEGVVGMQMAEEEKNEQLFALGLIDSLGRLRDKLSLPVIRNAWKEYGTEERTINYYLTLARLVDYSEINTLVERLKADYPQDENSRNAELGLRTGIIQVVGEYLKANANQEWTEMLQFLSEDSTYSEIQKAASGALAAFAETPEKKPVETKKAKP